MAEFLLGYAYEPEYTPEELVARSKVAASVCTEATSAGSDFRLVSVRVLLSNADIIRMRVLPHLWTDLRESEKKAVHYWRPENADCRAKRWSRGVRSKEFS